MRTIIIIIIMVGGVGEGGDIHKAYEIAFRIGVRCFLPPILDFVFEKLSFTFKGVVVAVAGVSKKMDRL